MNKYKSKTMTQPLRLNIQHFASGEGVNNNQAVRSYQKQFKELLQAVYQKQAYFSEFFGGGLEALDGVTHNKTAFSIKTSDIPRSEERRVGKEYSTQRS